MNSLWRPKRRRSNR